MRYTVLLGFCILLLSVDSVIYGSINIIQTGEQFNRALMKYPYAVVYLYSLTEKDKIERNDQYHKVIQETGALQAVAGERRYKKAAIHFLLVNVTRGGLQVLQKQYSIGAHSSALVLYRKGSLYSKDSEKMIDRVSIRAFIERYFKDFIDVRLQRVQEEKQMHRKHNRTKRSYVVYDPYPVPAWPYYGGYYGGNYYGPNIGFGFSVGI